MSNVWKYLALVAVAVVISVGTLAAYHLSLDPSVSWQHYGWALVVSLALGAVADMFDLDLTKPLWLVVAVVAIVGVLWLKTTPPHYVAVALLANVATAWLLRVRSSPSSRTSAA